MATPVEIATLRRYLYGGSTRTGSLSTDDIESYIDENVNLYLAAEQAADAEQINAIAGGRKKVGDLEIDPAVTAAGWAALSKKLRAKGVRGAGPYSGGISVADKASNRSDGDWDKPESRRGQFDYNGGSTGRTL